MNRREDNEWSAVVRGCDGRGRCALLVAIALLLGAAPAARAESGAKLLRQMDSAQTRAKDQVFDYEMVIGDPGKSTRKIGMRVHVRGKDKRRMEFLYPGDVKGMKVLILSRSRMYVYLPAYRKIRRIASHMREQSLFGADYNYDDMSTVTYAGLYNAKLVGSNAKHHHLRLTPKSSGETSYGRIELWLRKKDMMPAKLVYYNAKGKKVKTETRTGYTCKQKICNATVMKMVDHRRNGHWTKMVRKSWKVNTGFPERIFSRRTLQRRR